MSDSLTIAESDTKVARTLDKVLSAEYFVKVGMLEQCLQSCRTLIHEGVNAEDFVILRSISASLQGRSEIQATDSSDRSLVVLPIRDYHIVPFRGPSVKSLLVTGVAINGILRTTPVLKLDGALIIPPSKTAALDFVLLHVEDTGDGSYQLTVTAGQITKNETEHKLHSAYEDFIRLLEAGTEVGCSAGRHPQFKLVFNYLYVVPPNFTFVNKHQYPQCADHRRLQTFINLSVDPRDHRVSFPSTDGARQTSAGTVVVSIEDGDGNSGDNSTRVDDVTQTRTREMVQLALKAVEDHRFPMIQ
jgi:hypothetical protein